MNFSALLKNEDEASQMETVLKDIEHKYDTYFVDLWGVMHNGKEAFPKAIDAINKLLAFQKNVIFLSNMPRPKEIVFITLKEYGLNDGYNVVTSGDCTRDYLMENYKDLTIYHFGKDVNSDILDGLNLKITDDINFADVFVVTTFVDSREDLSPYHELCKEIANKNKPVICANPDHLASYGSTTRITAGYFCKKIEELGCFVHYIGKPFITLYQYAFKKFNIDVSNYKCLMIGDTVETDILGGYNASLDTCLTLRGITRSVLMNNNETILEHCERNKYPLPTYIMKELMWE